MNTEKDLKECLFCGSTSVNLKLCGACKVARYCSVAHQKSDWKNHKLTCKKPNSTSINPNVRDNHENFVINGKSKLKDVSEQNEDLTENSSNHKEKVLNDATNNPKCYPTKNVSKDVVNKESEVQESPLNLNPNLINSVLNSQPGTDVSMSSGLALAPPIDTQISFVNEDNESLTTKLSGQSLCDLDLSGRNFLGFDDIDDKYLTSIISFVLKDLNIYGFCAVDNFLGEEKAGRVLSEVKQLHSSGLLCGGRVVSPEVQADIMGRIRGDKITWVTGTEPGCSAIGMLASIVDAVIIGANQHKDAKELSKYTIGYRTKAMVACYPGGGTHYVKHIDNPNQDGRCITAIYYVNKNWTAKDGGELRIYPKDLDDTMAQIEPIFDRMLFFWSDRRNPHEVLPSSAVRYAITVWYLDINERKKHQTKLKGID